MMVAPDGDTLSAAKVFSTQPAVRVEPGARTRIRAWREASGRRIAVLDDDPTGSQTVHDVNVVTVLEEEQYSAGLEESGAICFIWTNTRSLHEAGAVELNTRVARSLFELADRLGVPVDLVSRGDSTLRGHVFAEVQAVDAARRKVTGRGYDGILLAPTYIEAGRVTAEDVQWARVGGELIQVGNTEFARDPTFGYSSSNLREFIAEKSGGAVSADEVSSITLSDIRLGGPDRVAEILRTVSEGSFVVVNATDPADLEIVVLGLIACEDAGRTFLYRTGPSFVSALAGLEPQEPLTARQIWPAGHPAGHGLVVVGSHVGLTSRQVAVARQSSGLVEVPLDVSRATDPVDRDGYVADTTRRVVAAMADSDVVLVTSRTLMLGNGADDNVKIASTISGALTRVTRGALTAKPVWVVAKGGITAHDVAVQGLGIRRARVLGQLLPGMVSVLRPVDADEAAVGTPYVVFAGNVGDENTLSHVVSVLKGRA
jgi:uncharacterized protein YgbK (DUF1537 family)